MTNAFSGGPSSDCTSCRYGSSRLLFRGPALDISNTYIAVLGGTETYGKFVRRPYPRLIRLPSPIQALNLGCMNASPDAFLGDSGVLEIARKSRAVVLQIMGAQNMSNRLYMVHPRQNDRFVAARPALCALYPEVDFTEFNFTRHMLTTLREVSESRFEQVVDELRAAWVPRMKALMSHLPSDVILLWIAEQSPQARPPIAAPDRAPMLVDAEMIEAIRPLASDWVEVLFPAGDTARTFWQEAKSGHPVPAPVIAPPGPSETDQPATGTVAAKPRATGLHDSDAHHFIAERLSNSLTRLLFPEI
jgi:hypothetical protein